MGRNKKKTVEVATTDEAAVNAAYNIPKPPVANDWRTEGEPLKMDNRPVDPDSCQHFFEVISGTRPNSDHVHQYAGGMYMVPLRYLTDVHPTSILMALACARGNDHAQSKIKYPLPTSYNQFRFFVGFCNPQDPQFLDDKPNRHNEIIHNFLRKRFTLDGGEDNQSILDSLKYSPAFFILAANNSSQAEYEVIGVLLFAPTKEATFINWFAIHHGDYDKQSGNKSAATKFEGMGLGTYLLMALQLYLRFKAYNCSLYLQANPGEQAYEYYCHRGFKVLTGNTHESLPNSIQPGSGDSKGCSPYVHYIDDTDDPDHRLRLMHLDHYLQINTESANGHFLFTFPFTMVNGDLDKACPDLLILGGNVFYFQDKNSIMRGGHTKRWAKRNEVENAIAGEKISITPATYKSFKEDNATDNPKQFLNDEMMQLAISWYVTLVTKGNHSYSC